LTAWQAARSGAALLGVPDGDAGLATLLDDLDHLTRQELEQAELADRIAKMVDNSRAFHAAAANVFVALSLPDATAWSGIGDRLTTAQQAERDHTMSLPNPARLCPSSPMTSWKPSTTPAPRRHLLCWARCRAAGR